MFYGFIIVCGVLAAGPCLTNSFADDPEKGIGFMRKSDCDATIEEANEAVLKNPQPKKLNNRESFLNYGCFSYEGPVTDTTEFQMYIWNHYGPTVKKEVS